MTYNPMSKEFQDECKRLGLTGYQLRQKYEKEGKSLEICIYKDGRGKPRRKGQHGLTDVCPRCREENNVTDDSILYIKNARRENDKYGKETGRWICPRHWHRDYNMSHISTNSIIKLSQDYRISNQDPNSNNTKGDNSQELACELYEWEDLNKKYGNYKSPVDCYDPKTGLYHQVQGHHYNSRNRCGPFAGFEKEWEKIFEDMVCFCISNDGRIIERLYIFPKAEIERVKGIGIYKNPMNTRGTRSIVPWYEEYRVKDEDELKRANEIWKEIKKYKER